ncbi:hypothetical protein AMECASPLE_038788 [Ameca splendens]|uniref:Uncharacterized protein n=1 Tax=Ameca splendens TaxID=208324 RepID=A0ABV0YJD2_9TELE
MGELTQGEVYSAIKKEREQTESGASSTTAFSGEMHFYELVEDTKDGIWLVQILIQHTRPHLGFKTTEIGWGVNSILPTTPPHTIKFLLSLHRNHLNATLRQDDNSVNSS